MAAINKNKQKGNRFEREIVNRAKEFGLNAVRAYASNGKSIGEAEDVDCKVANFRVQAKIRKRLPIYLIPSENVDITVFRQDRGETLALIRFDDLLKLIKEASK